MKSLKGLISSLLIVTLFASCSGQSKKASATQEKTEVYEVSLTPPAGKAIAAFAEGCFWCSEHIFEAVVGVDSVISGYAGGTTNNPTYARVNTETTGHAETILVYYDPSIIDYKELTNVFFTSHDPTTKDRQGPDRGNSYRSILFYSTPQELDIAVAAKKRYEEGGLFANPIVTEIAPLKAFYRAEGYHQDYIHHNPGSPYVIGVSIPRYELFKKTYQGKLKKE
ncbi:MAG: peptide-methionine (S)-S-oxide reductase MsrA [Cyclobacteriaceae bacterium]